MVTFNGSEVINEKNPNLRLMNQQLRLVVNGSENLYEKNSN